MSSNIPVRRSTRTTKVTKDTENANAKPSRIMTRAKTAASSTQPENTNRLTATTAASRAKSVESAADKTAVKRKREILGEVTESSRKSKPSGKGKEKEKAGSVDRSGSAGKAKVATKIARGPLREVGGSGQKPSRSKTVAGDRGTLRPIKEHGDNDEIMADEPAHAAVFRLVEPLHRDFDDEPDSEPVFKKRITEDDQNHQPTARPPLDESQAEEDRIATELVDVNEEDDEELGTWDDLDAEDADDPTAPTEDYMQFHSELDWDKRTIILEWVLEIHARYNFLAESFFLFVNIIDRFLSLRPTVSLKKLQLLGVACFCVAVKYEEGVAPSTKELVLLTGEIYTVKEICKAEQYVLQTLNFDLSHPGPMTWLRRGSKADDLDPGARTIAKFLLELAAFSPFLVAVPSSIVAAATLWFARMVLGREEWTPNLAHYTSYKEREIIPVAEILLNDLLSSKTIEKLYKKYASKKYMKCSVYVRKWVMARFEMGAQVDLASVLPQLKEQIVESRLAKMAEEDGGVYRW
ncbi:hypothetical protein BT96DRAFT_927314 [Gymnopus androsaceus JB14]|uniref:Cyclin N-terminal domain-containing protein n=1 Tax=Gymnopus androsaceus JB14 TaxID=1447944 RepID=A0A6A4GS01_9AGAR|nr:hypothetical protein BT96DRAFT_927314 [Gymnopus androsaceus JB14]